MAALGVLFALLVLVETVSGPDGPAAGVLSVVSWILWAIFLTEFVVRATAARSTATFLRRNWWQVLFLALPFLRFVRVLWTLRTVHHAARAGRVVSSMIRTGRNAHRRLTSRVAWLVVVTACVIVGGSQILYEVDPGRPFEDALHEVALAAIAGVPLRRDGWLRVLDVALVTYSVAALATLAGAIGSFLLERRREDGGGGHSPAGS